MGNSAEFASGHSQFSNGKEIAVFISELVFAILAVNRKMFAKFVPSICNLDCPWM